MFANKPITAFKRNKNIKDLIHDHLIKDGKAAKKILEKQQGKSKIGNTTMSALCCMQVKKFKSKETKELWRYTIPLHAKVNGLSTY